MDPHDTLTIGFEVSKDEDIMIQQMVVSREFQAATKRQRLESFGSKTHSPTTHLPNHIVGYHYRDHLAFLSGIAARDPSMMEAIFCKRTAMNFFIFFATSAANRALVIGRCFTVKSVVEIYGGCGCKIGVDRASFAGFTFECQGEHPTS